MDSINMPCGIILFYHVSYATPYKMDDVSFLRLNTNNFEIFLKLPHGNTSFVLKVTTLVTW